MAENERESRAPIDAAPESKEMPTMRWRVGLSIVTGVGWVLFLILWLFFYAAMYTIYQNIAVILVSFLIILGILGITWASTLKTFKPSEAPELAPTLSQMGWRISLSILLGVGWLVFLLGWLGFYAATYTIYQNIAVTLISFLLLGAVISVVWGSLLRPSRPTDSGEELPTMGWRIVLSAILGIGWLGFFLFWLLFYAPLYTVYQNIAIFLLSLLIMAAIYAPIWTLVRTMPENAQ